MGIVYGDGSWFGKGCSDFVDHVVFEKVKVQLGLSAHVDGESAYLTFHFSFFGFAAIIRRASGSKLNDVVPRF